MRGAMLADTHLGFRAFAATIEGRNAREVDTERAWFRAIDAAIATDVDLVTISGDVVHHPRVGGHAIKALRDGLGKLSDADIPVVVIQGNHDGGRTAEVLTPIVIPDDLPGVHVVTQVKRIRLEARSTGQSVAVTCLPFVIRAAEEATYSLDPDPDADVNILVIHAPVNTSAEGVDRLPTFYAGEESLDVGRLAEQYDVIAAGDFHEFRRLHPTRIACYPGSLERTSSNIWDETAEKGIVIYDTASEQFHLREIETRAMYDYSLADLQDAPASADAVNEALMTLTLLDVLDDSITRLKVDDFPRGEKDRIDWALVRGMKQQCLHFQLDIRYSAAGAIEAGDRRDRSARSLMDEAREFFAEDPEDVRDAALAYLGGDL